MPLIFELSRRPAYDERSPPLARAYRRLHRARPLPRNARASPAARGRLFARGAGHRRPSFHAGAGYPFRPALLSSCHSRGPGTGAPPLSRTHGPDHAAWRALHPAGDRGYPGAARRFRAFGDYQHSARGAGSAAGQHLWSGGDSSRPCLSEHAAGDAASPDRLAIDPFRTCPTCCEPQSARGPIPRATDAAPRPPRGVHRDLSALPDELCHRTDPRRRACRHDCRAGDLSVAALRFRSRSRRAAVARPVRPLRRSGPRRRPDHPAAGRNGGP